MVRTRFALRDGTIDRARSLRRTATLAEQRFWAIVRDRRLDGFKFRRQQRFGVYVADFACHEARLIVEIDGDTHADGRAITYDAARTRYIEQEGYRVLRFSNADIIGNPDGVFSAMRQVLAPSPSHSAASSGPLPLPQRGEEA